MDKTLNKRVYTVNKVALIPSLIILFAFIACGIFALEATGNAMNTILYGLAAHAGWFINILSLVSLILALVVVLLKYGNVRIGGPDAKPDFKTFNWIAMSLCGGIGTGLLFWAMGEPIFHYATPPVAAGVEPFSRDAAIFAVSQAMWDWSFIQYSMYSLCAVAFALVVYNRKKALSFGSVIEGAFGKPMPRITTLVHAVTIFTLCGAVANSMGVGLMQIGAGLESVAGIKQSPVIWLFAAIGIGIIFVLSCVSGIGNGLKKLSSFTVYIFIAIMLYVFFVGDPMFITKLGSEAIGEIFDDFAGKSLYNNALAPDDTWSADWIIQYFASFIVYAPVIGMFLSRLAKGRTVKQFLMVNVCVPSLFCWVWIAIFGSMTMNLQASGEVDVWTAVNELGMQATVFQILGSLPLGGILTIVFLIALITSFSTLADPMSAVLATVATNELDANDEAPRNLKILFGVIICTMSFLLVASGGVNSVKGMFVLVGFIIAFVMIACYIACFKQIKQCGEAQEKGIELN
jgi:glycine betaine transporter